MIQQVPDSAPSDAQLLTITEVARYLDVPVATVRTWRANKAGPPGYRVGRHVRYRREDVEAWLEQRSDDTLRRG